MFTPSNHLIQQLPQAAKTAFLAQSELVQLPLDFVLWKPNTETSKAYFPVNGYISLEAMSPDSPPLEVNMIGREGMAGLHLLYGAASSNLSAMVRIKGSAYVCEAPHLKQLMLESPPFRVAMWQYIQLTLTQLSSSVACGRYHSIRQRLAKWLLMASDRSDDDGLHIKQSTIAGLLGVRRVSITIAASEIQVAGYIRYSRGVIQILHRNGLESCACSCYKRLLRAE